MGYYTGTAADIAAVRTALVNACVTTEGWTWDVGNEVLWKDTIFVKIQAITDGNWTRLALLGKTALTGGTDAPGAVIIGRICAVSIAFPVTYYVFVFAKEVYFVINYSDIYQWCAFGQSSQAGLPVGAIGNWVAASQGFDPTIPHPTWPYETLSLQLSGYTDYAPVPALFWRTKDGGTLGLISKNYWLHNNFQESIPWHLGIGATTNSDEAPLLSSANSIMELLKTQPNAFNNESVLLPIRAYKRRDQSKFSQVLELENARHIRIDNYEPKEIIQYGSDKWKVFPWYKKNIAARDGGTFITHTGTFGWAIRYEGS